MEDLAPVAITVFNRADHIEKTLTALQKNTFANLTEVHIFSDHWDKDEDMMKVLAVREVIRKDWEFKKVILHEAQSRGKLQNSVINAVSTVLENSDRVIVLEDDIVTSVHFLSYMNNMLTKYEENQMVGSIAGYNHNSKIMPIPENYKYETYFSPRPSSWGWATWKHQWAKVDWDVSDFIKLSEDKTAINGFNKAGGDLFAMLRSQQEGKTNSWAIRWAYHHYSSNLLALYPIISYVNNIGLDGSGSNFKSTTRPYYSNDQLNKKDSLSIPLKVKVDLEVLKAFRNVYARGHRYYIRKIKGKLGI